MIIINVNGREYKLEYGYHALANSGLVGVLKLYTASIKIGKPDTTTFIRLIAETVLEGLQKHHKDFQYYWPKQKIKKINKVYELLDDYEKSGNETDPHDIMQLYNACNAEINALGLMQQVQLFADPE